MTVLNFDIESTSKEDGAKHTYYRQDEKDRIIEKVKNASGLKAGQVLDILERDLPVQTCFFIYRKAEK